MRIIRQHCFEIALVFLLLLGFFYRLYGLKQNYSFWADEASTARFARGVLETGVPKIKETNFTLDAYFTTHYLTAFSFLVFGENELAARLPEVIFGTILISVMYLLGREIFNKRIALGGALFTAFSYIQIAWSRQARGYVIYEVFFILSLFWLFKFLQNNKTIDALAFLFLMSLTIFTHTLGFLLIPIGFCLLLSRFSLKELLFHKRFYLVSLAVFALIFLLPITGKVISYLFDYDLPGILQKKNILFYYHSLFWRQYSLFTFLMFLSLLILWTKRDKDQTKAVFFILGFSIYLLIISFFLDVPFEKYVLVLFPLLFLVSSSALYSLSNSLFKTKMSRDFFFFLLIFFILFNGNKFSFKPRQFYTLNFDMREIPEIDYKSVYELVEKKTKTIDKERLAIVDIDEDIPAWYLGEGGKYFNPRKDVEGLKRSASVGAVFVHSLEEFKQVYQHYDYGFILLVEHNFRFYPEGLVEFVRDTLRLEKREEFAKFSPDWNRWPIEFYSWGFE